MTDAEMARAYIKITKEMGPSEQLMAFIDPENSLGSEIGLEEFGSFSLQTKHEILVSKLDPTGEIRNSL